ncbi:hypothetical protein Tco_0679241 [Tanacetum coccineum]|uniref:Uncharacterized protein n=1 Tax=Tanacetum coccineum TaxID=301880 RepID=A0ABQ4XIS1_9ASTR
MATSNNRPIEVPLISRCKVANGGYREKVQILIGTVEIQGEVDQLKRYELKRKVLRSFNLNGNNLCDAVICAFLAIKPNLSSTSQKIWNNFHPDDLEKDFKWEMAMRDNSRARRFIQKLGRS